MKLEKSEKSLIFSSTEIPDVFFTEYMCEANGDYIKVYLCMVFLSKFDKDIKLNDLSKKLNIPLNNIQAALAFWEEKGVITKKMNGYILNDLQEICINNMYFQGVMSPAWYSDIDLWFKKYEFDEQVMISLFDYCFNKSALHKNYVTAVADAWHKSNIKTYEDLEAYSSKQEKLAKMKKDGATVSSDVLVKICTALECTMDDIVDIIPSSNN